MASQTPRHPIPAIATPPASRITPCPASIAASHHPIEARRDVQPDGAGPAVEVQQGAPLAEELAQALACGTASGPSPCGVCTACRKIAELKESSTDLAEDYKNLSRLLAS